MTQKCILYTGLWCSSWAWRKGELCSLLFTRIYLKWRNYWDGSCMFISINLSGHTYTEVDGVLYKPVSVLQHSVCYGHFFAIQCPSIFCPALTPGCCTSCGASLASCSGPAWCAAPGHPGTLQPPLHCAAHSSHGTCPRRAHSVEKLARLLCRATI